MQEIFLQNIQTKSGPRHAPYSKDFVYFPGDKAAGE